MAGASDLLDLDGEFSEAELALRATVREFVDSRIRPGIAGWYEEARFPTEHLGRVVTAARAVRWPRA